MITSVVAFAGTGAAVRTTMTVSDEVTRPGTVDAQSTVDVQEGEDVRIESFTLTLRPAGSAGEEVRVTFAPDGTVLSIAPDRGVVGNGQVRIAELRRSLSISISGSGSGYGYDAGSGYGYDAGSGYGYDAGSGYGYDAGSGYGYGDASVTVDASFSSGALKRGGYELFLSVNTRDGEGLYPSNVQRFEVVVAGGSSTSDSGVSASGDGNENGNGNGNARGPPDERGEGRPVDAPPRRGGR